MRSVKRRYVALQICFEAQFSPRLQHGDAVIADGAGDDDHVTRTRPLPANVAFFFK